MSFDQGSDLPIVNLHKRTTQVNASMIIGVILFFVATAAVVFFMWRNPGPMVNQTHEKQELNAKP